MASLLLLEQPKKMWWFLTVRHRRFLQRCRFRVFGGQSLLHFVFGSDFPRWDILERWTLIECLSDLEQRGLHVIASLEVKVENLRDFVILRSRFDSVR